MTPSAPVLWEIFSVSAEKNKVLTSWDEQFPYLFLWSPDVRLFSLIPKNTAEKHNNTHLSQCEILQDWLKVFCYLKPDVLTEGVAAQLNVEPDVSSLSPAPWSLYLIQNFPIFLVLLQETSAHCSQETTIIAMHQSWVQACFTPNLPMMEGQLELKQNKLKGCEERTMRITWPDLLPSWVIVENWLPETSQSETWNRNSPASESRSLSSSSSS